MDLRVLPAKQDAEDMTIRQLKREHAALMRVYHASEELHRAQGDNARSAAWDEYDAAMREARKVVGKS